ncbi:galactose-1-phosphate uridylyltransferase [Formosa sp. 4Alg 33]|uniref:galactose-1-phosphate uridylyltransferase n=1 Tax=Formosa sp. 4Alg 33 TaxID=3382189 RepID=UPI003D9C3AAD
MNAELNPIYEDVFMFTNDFSALQNDSKSFQVNNGLMLAQSETDICKVICLSPDDSKSLADTSVNAIEKVVFAWQKEYSELSKIKTINYVQIFKNKGAVMGCSNPHPHG